MLLECQALLREQSFYQLLSQLLQHLAFCTLDFKEQGVPSSNLKGEASAEGQTEHELRDPVSYSYQLYIREHVPSTIKALIYFSVEKSLQLCLLKALNKLLCLKNLAQYLAPSRCPLYILSYFIGCRYASSQSSKLRHCSINRNYKLNQT